MTDLESSTTGMMITLEEYRQLTSQVEQLSKRVKTYQYKQELLVNQLTKKHEEITLLKQQAKDLSRHSLHRMANSLHTHETLQHDLQRKEGEIIFLCQERERLKKQIDAIEAETIVLNDEIEKEKTLTKEAVQEKRKAEEKAREKEEEVRRLEAELLAVRTQGEEGLREKAAQCWQLKEDKEAAERECDELRKTINRNIGVLQYQGSQHEISGSFSSSRQALFRTEGKKEGEMPPSLEFTMVSSIRSINEQLSRDNKELKDSLSEKESTIRGLEVKVLELQREMDMLREATLDLKKRSSEKETRKSEISQPNSSIISSQGSVMDQSQMEALQSSLLSEQKEKTELKSKLEKYRFNYQKLKKEHDEAKSKIAILEDTLNKATASKP